MPNPRVLILGLDAADPDLLERFMAAGELPAFAALRQQGAFGRLRSSINCVTPSAWTSMATGVGPGRHGIFNFIEYLPTSHSIRIPDSTHRRVQTIWELAGDAGQRCCILRVPMTFPASPVNGWLVADTLAPSIHHDGFAWPRELAGDLLATFGPRGWGEKWEDDQPSATGKYGRALRQLMAGIDRGFDLIEYSLDRSSWDLMFAVLHEPDEAGHNFLHLMEAQSPYHDPAAARRFADGLLRVYRRVDARLGALVRRLSGETTIMIVSDHGIGWRRTVAWYVRALLVGAGFQVLREAPAQSEGIRQHLLRMRRAVTRRIPWDIRRRLRPLSRDVRQRGAAEALLGSVDWHSTTAFALIGNDVGEIWLHLAERCPAGTVQPGEAQETVLAAVRSLLESAVDARSGQRVVERIEAGSEACPGPFGEAIPDLVVTFDEDIYCEAVTATNPFTGEPVTVDDASPGTWELQHRAFHRRDGVLLAAGPGISVSDETVQGSVMDIAPTALYLLGLPIPEDLEARLLEEVLETAMLREHPPAAGPPLPAREAAEAALSAEDRAKVEERLRELGYL